MWCFTRWLTWYLGLSRASMLTFMSWTDSWFVPIILLKYWHNTDFAPLQIFMLIAIFVFLNYLKFALLLIHLQKLNTATLLHLKWISWNILYLKLIVLQKIHFLSLYHNTRLQFDFAVWCGESWSANLDTCGGVEKERNPKSKLIKSSSKKLGHDSQGF